MAKIHTKSNDIIQRQIISGKSVVFRYPKFEDVKDLAKTINSLVEDRSEIAKTTKVTINEEKKWLTGILKLIGQKEKIMIVAEVDGIVIGGCEVTKDPFDVSRHVGTLGVGIQKEMRGFGIGKKLVQICIAESKKKLGLRLVKLYVFHTNKTGKSLYEKLGFKETGRIGNGVFHNGRYKDDIIMIKRL